MLKSSHLKEIIKISHHPSFSGQMLFFFFNLKPLLNVVLWFFYQAFSGR